MSLIFISYRRDDSAPYAGRLYDRLKARFGDGQVFMDIDQIDPGEDFVEVIERKVGACGIALVLIGKGWLNASDAQGKRRLDDPEDFVRLEVAAALRREVRVLPVLVGGATMPRMQQLPQALAKLSRRNAFEISDTRFHSDVDKLIEALERASTPGEAAPSRSEPRAGDPSAAAGQTGPSVADGSIAAAATTRPIDPTTKNRLLGGLAALGVGIGIFTVAMVWEGLASSSAKRPAQTAAPSASIQQAPDRDSIAVIGGPKAEAIFGGVTRLVELSRRAVDGSAEAQYELATNYECGQPRDLGEALHWYELAAAQGHSPSREVLAKLRTPLPTEARAKEVESLQRDMDCSGRLQKSTAKVFDQLNDKAGIAARNIKREEMGNR